MTFYALLPLCATILNLFLVIFILTKGAKRKLNHSFALVSLCVMVWNFGYFLLYIAPSRNFAFSYLQVVFFGAVFIPPTFLYFMMALTDQITKKTKIVCLTAFVYSLTLFILNFWGFCSNDVIRYYWGYSPIGPKTSIFFLFSFLSYMFYALFLLFKTMRKTVGIRHNQLKYVFWGAMIALGGGLTNFLPIVSFIRLSIYPVGNGTVFLFLGIIAYAIYKHQLMDIDIVIKKGAVYAYLSFSVLVPCIAIIIFAQYFFFHKINTFFSLLAFSTLLLASLVILRVKPDIEEYIEKRLFKRKYEYKKTLSELSEVIVSFLDEKELFKKAGNIFTQDLGTEGVSFFMLNKEKGFYTLRASQNLRKIKRKELPREDLLLQWVQEKGKAAVREEIERIRKDPRITSVVKTMESMESEVSIPLMTRDELIGIINLGHKRSGAMYSHEDLDLLSHFATQASVALENARLYQEMHRTHMLMRRTDRLASLGSLTANLAHEIRNPLVTIKTFLELFPQRYKDKDFRGDFLKLTSSELDRLNTLVTQLLSFARPAQPNVEKGDINQVLEDVINLVTVEANKRDIAIDTNLQKTRQVLLDSDQMKQVFLNIILNAFEAIKNHGRISVISRDIHKNGNAYVQVEITDNGKGIPEKIVEHIFDPFFTTKKKGGGLGLSISHQIVQEHKGTIEVESRAKKGTTFVINIPCKT
jgi:two-component system NtrC family sensor kinase